MKDYSGEIRHYEAAMRYLINLQKTGPYSLMLGEKIFVSMSRIGIVIRVPEGDYSIADMENSWKQWPDILSEISTFKNLFIWDGRCFYEQHINWCGGYKISRREQQNLYTKIMEINRKLNYPDIIFRSEYDGCYVATAVYGSYDCPEVWTLRRFRDKTLAETWYGRAFIRLYYAISPTLVKYFGKAKWFQRLFRKPLDGFVKKLNASGFEDTPYDDKIY